MDTLCALLFLDLLLHPIYFRVLMSAQHVYAISL